jgi:flagellar biogenesis protein FliO
MIGLGIAWFMRRYVVRDSALGGGKINMVAAYTLSPKSKVYLLRVGSQTFLVGEGANELNLLSEVNLSSPNLSEEELLASMGTDTGGEVSGAGDFESKLNQWQSALKSKDIGSEVNTSLLLLGGLAQRLRNKREG